MSPTNKIAARGAIFSLPVGMLMMYWAWGLFPSMVTRLEGYVFFVLILVPVSSVSALTVWWSAMRWGRSPFLAMVVGMSVGVFAFCLESALLHFAFPARFGKPFSPADILPGLIVGAVIGFSGIGRIESTGSKH